MLNNVKAKIVVLVGKFRHFNPPLVYVRGWLFAPLDRVEYAEV